MSEDFVHKGVSPSHVIQLLGLATPVKGGFVIARARNVLDKIRLNRCKVLKLFLWEPVLKTILERVVQTRQIVTLYSKVFIVSEVKLDCVLN